MPFDINNACLTADLDNRFYDANKTSGRPLFKKFLFKAGEDVLGLWGNIRIRERFSVYAMWVFRLTRIRHNEPVTCLGSWWTVFLGSL
jgi:hypothetical protein